METQLESASFIYRDKELIGMIKRDDVSKKHLVYSIKEATATDITKLLFEKTLIAKEK